MQIQKLDHVNIRTIQLELMIEWYERVLGLRLGQRPNFPFPGAWLYANETAIVHLVGHEGLPATGSETDLKLEHFALAASGRALFVQNLEKAGQKYQCIELEDVNITQFHLQDPDGNHIHVDFAGVG